MKKTVLLFALLLPQLCYAAILGPFDPNDLPGIQAAYNASTTHEGDTIRIASGTGNWDTAGLSLTTKNVTIVGAGWSDNGGTNINHKGTAFNITVSQSDKTMDIGNLHLHTNGGTVGNNNDFNIGGIGRCYTEGGVAKGGLRIHNVRFTLDSSIKDQAGGHKHWVFTEWVTGVIDHCFIDYPIFTSYKNTGPCPASEPNCTLWYEGAESSFVSNATSPNGTEPAAAGTNTKVAPSTVFANRGIWSWFAPYVAGAPIPDVNPTNKANDDGTTGGKNDTSGDTMYIEDCILNKMWQLFDCESQPRGGARRITRHCSMAANNGGHGIDSGDMFGTRSRGEYNNKQFYPIKYRSVTNPGNLVSPEQAVKSRGAEQVSFNNYFGNFKVGTNGMIQLQMYRQDGNGSIFGIPDGTNPWDLNAKGTITTVTGDSAVPKRVAPDAWVGDVYSPVDGSGNPVCTWAGGGKITGLLSPAANYWAGFVLRIVRPGFTPAENAGGPLLFTTGGFGNSGAGLNNNACGWAGAIHTSVSDGAGNTIVTFDGPSTTACGLSVNLQVGDKVEVRRVLQYINTLGSGAWDHPGNGADLQASFSVPEPPPPGGPGGTTKTPKLLALTGQSFTGPFPPGGNAKSCPKWPNQLAKGIWMWNNWYKLNYTLGSPDWQLVPAESAATKLADNVLIAGGLHQNFGAPSGYPHAANPAPTQARRVGADWDAEGYFAADGSQPYGPAIYVGPNEVYGEPYPHPLVSAPVPSAPNFSDSSPLEKSFAVGTSIDFDIVASGNPVPVLSLTGSLPTGVSHAETAGSGRMRIYTPGTPPGTVQNTTATITANNGQSPNATLTLNMHITAGNSAPTNVAISSPTASTPPYQAPANITISGSADDSDGKITKLEFYSGASCTNLVGTYTPTTPASHVSGSVDWNAVPAGSYSLTMKAYDNNSTPATTCTSTAIPITVNAVAPKPTPAQIIVRP